MEDEQIKALSRMVGEQNTTIGYQDAMLARLDAELALARAVCDQLQQELREERARVGALRDRYEEAPSGPFCPDCGCDLDWIYCDQCGGEGLSYHDCGEDCCACLDPEPNVRCDQCDGKGGWHWCTNRECQSKKDSDD